MGDTPGMIYPEANCSLAMNLWNQTSHVLPKYNGVTCIGSIFPFQRGRNRKEKRNNRSQVSPKPNRANNIKAQSLRISFFVLILCSRTHWGCGSVSTAFLGWNCMPMSKEHKGRLFNGTKIMKRQFTLPCSKMVFFYYIIFFHIW